MEAVQSWTKDYFQSNQEACLVKLKSLLPEERAALMGNLERNENRKIVLLRGMISDMLESEFYCEKYEVKSKDGTVLRMESGKFADKLNIKDDEIVEDVSKHLGERRTVLISKPASTNQWVDEAESSSSENNKRKLEDSQEAARCFTVKIYENTEIPINTVVEVVGFLSISAKPSSGESPMIIDDFSGETQAPLPPLTIHSIFIKELPHSNPLLLDTTDPMEHYSGEEIRKDLMKVLTQFMFGDETAADYVLCHLISNVYARVSGEVLGKFSLNLTCSSVPKELLSDHVKKFYNLIELLLPNSCYLPLTIENLNTKSFVPKKDYTTNRLQTGFLQLPKHTHILLDETKLQTGKLDEPGCLAVADLTELIQTQQLNYDFRFYKIPFHTNYPVLIFGEGKSLLPSDFIVPIKAEEYSVRLIHENIAAAIHFLKPKLNAVRRYLTECRLRDFEIDENVTKVIENDFVKMREDKNLQVENLHALLVVSRLLGISKGMMKLDLATWNAAKHLEVVRINRVEKRNTNES